MAVAFRACDIQNFYAQEIRADVMTVSVGIVGRII